MGTFKILSKIMKPELSSPGFNKMFKYYCNESQLLPLQPEIERYINHFDCFLPGDSFYFILNHHHLQFEVVSKDIEKVLGYTALECNVQFFTELLHPEDYADFLTFGQSIVHFFSQLPDEKITKYKVRHDLRYKKKNGEFARILYQGLVLEHDHKGGLLRSIGVNSDISYLKQQGRPLLSFIGMEGEPSFVDFSAKDSFVEGKDEFTKREKQILALLIEGKLSKEIGTALKISKQTVDTHRKNMLHKKHLSNTSLLVSNAIKHGWL